MQCVHVPQIMADRKLSGRTQRRLRLQLKRRLVEKAAEIKQSKKQRVASPGADSSESDGAEELVSWRETDEFTGAGPDLLGSDSSSTTSSDSEGDSCAEARPLSSSEDMASRHELQETADACVGAGTDLLDRGGSSTTSSDTEGDSYAEGWSSDAWQSSDSGTSSSENDSESDSSLYTLLTSTDDETCPSTAHIDEYPSLYVNSTVNSRHFQVSFMSLAQRHNLTYSSQNDILKLMNALLPTPNTVPSFHTLRASLVDFKRETVVHHYCGNCMDVLTQGNQCPKEGCMRAMEAGATFVEIPLADQLKERFKGIIMPVAAGSDW